MGKVSNLATRVYFDEFDISGAINATDLSFEQERIPVACFSDSGPRRLVGNYDHKATLNGFFDGASSGFDPQAFIDLNTDEDHYLTQLFGANAIGSKGYDTICRLMEQPRSGGVGGAVLLNLSVEGSRGAVRCTVLCNTAITVTGNQSGQNMGATTAGQTFQVIARVLSAAGSGSIAFAVQESSDGGADPYSTISGLTGTFNGLGANRLTTTAATEAWKRVTITTFTGFTSVTLLVTAGVVAGT